MTSPSGAAPGEGDDLAPAGSEDYYIARLHPAGERLRVATHLALEARLLGVLREGGDPAILRLRLAWWQDCLEAACRGDYRHPLVARLAALDGGTAGHWRVHLAAAARALPERLAWQTPRPADEILDNLRRVEGVIAFALACDLAPQADPASLTRVVELAAATHWARSLQWLPHWRSLGLHLIPREILAAHRPAPAAGTGTNTGTGTGTGISPDAHEAAHWPRLAQAFVEHALGLALSAHRELPHALARATLSARIRHACGRAELARCAAAGWPVLRERVTLTPIARLLIALGVAWLDRLPGGPVSPRVGPRP